MDNHLSGWSFCHDTLGSGHYLYIDPSVMAPIAPQISGHNPITSGIPYQFTLVHSVGHQPIGVPISGNLVLWGDMEILMSKEYHPFLEILKSDAGYATRPL